MAMARRAGGAGAGRGRFQLAGRCKVLAVTCTYGKQPEGPLSFTVPSCGAAQGRLPERPKGAVCKTVGFAFPGSNPGPATSQSCSSGGALVPLALVGAMPSNAIERSRLGMPWDIRGMAAGERIAIFG